MRKNNVKTFVCLMLFLFSWVGVATGEDLQVPPREKGFYVYDPQKIISEENSKHIIDLNKNLNKDTGAQIVVAVVQSTESSSIEDYSLNFFREWKIGDKDKNNGILMLVSIEDRKIRIEVGYGLEGAIPDITANDIQNDIMIPLFKKEKYDEGIKAGFDEIYKKVTEEYGIQSENGVEKSKNFKDVILGKLGMILLLVIFIIAMILDRIFFRGALKGILIHLVMACINMDEEDFDDEGGGGSAGGGGSTEEW